MLYFNQFLVHYLLFLAMELVIVHWEMMESLPMETLVVSHVTLVISQLVVTLGHVRVMGVGVVVIICVEEVLSTYIFRI